MSSLDSTQSYYRYKYHINIFSAHLQNKIKTYNNKKYPTM